MEKEIEKLLGEPLPKYGKIELVIQDSKIMYSKIEKITRYHNK